MLVPRGLSARCHLLVRRSPPSAPDTMPDKNENQKHVAHAGGVKEAKVDAERLKKRIQRHYDVTSDQFLKVWCGVLLLGHI